MVKSVLSVSHQGLRDWVIQRISAIIIAIYSIGFVIYILLHPQLSFMEWRTLFTFPSIKILTVLFLLSLVFHAWIGIWTIITDYINCYVIRFIVHLFVFFILFASFVWGLLILWSA